MKEITLFVLLCCGIVVFGKQCCPDGVIISPRGKCGTEPMVSMNCSNGRLLLKDIILNGNKVSTQDTPDFVFAEDPDEYCLGAMYKNGTDSSSGIISIALVCFEPSLKANDIETSGILTLISVVFLLATFAVYTYFPNLRDLQGLCYMSMSISMALGFLSLGVLQLNTGFRQDLCTLTGFVVYTWMIATFFWMNVICINVCRSVLNASRLAKSDRKQFLWYSCYAWGGTLALLFVAIITTFVDGDHWKPGFGESSCWFNGRTETWIFFYGPIACLIAFNIGLFLLSFVHLWLQTIKYEVNKLNNLKYKFLLSLKLFLVMGISWIFEIASFAHGKSHIIWKIMDIFNCLQGVIIFLLLVVLRKKVIQNLTNENCCVFLTRRLSDKLSPHDDSDDQQNILGDETVEVRLN
ncbi:probable G-protein coupled receptor Mth-like 2 [Bombyx mandarina]|uniref:Probable G-protein coupled receptor Mth-like 2 n=1 Tax=Bombyx mandarina TaxID=7092 RepID=A0A6J2K8T5_BOMMA|nr:probable G-protein coupled receptor Mth-like 2 [Bombyx mandarina]